MSASAATRLRQLATQYHGGEIDLSSYRRMRAELLDRLAGAEPEFDESSTTLPQRSRAAPAAAPAPAAPRAPPPATAPATQAAPRKGGSAIYIVLGLVLVAGAAGYFFFLRPAAPAESVAAAPPADTSSESYLAINDFLAADDWSDDQIANFNTRWAPLPVVVPGLRRAGSFAGQGAPRIDGDG
jgi:hypothetical protein